jgi:hypothetical protein
MRKLDSFLAPSIFIIVAGLAFSFYSIPYVIEPIRYVEQICPGQIPPPSIKYLIVIYPKRQFRISLVVTGSILTTLVLTIQAALSHT